MQATAKHSDLHRAAHLFRGCRMVLLVDFTTPTALSFLNGQGIPCLGLTPDSGLAAGCRRQGLVAWAGEWPRLQGYRERFDGVHLPVPPADPVHWPTLFHTLAAALLPGGLLVVDRMPPHPEASSHAAAQGLEVVSHDPDGTLLARRPAIPVAPEPGYPEVVGAYADALVGAGPVVVPGCGEGAFLDALTVRDIPCIGFEEDEAAVRRCRERGLDVHRAGVDALADRPASCGGLLLADHLEKLDPPARRRLLALAAHALRPGGTLLIRLANLAHPEMKDRLFPAHPHYRRPCPPSEVHALCREQGLAVEETAALPRDPRHYFVLARRRGGVDPDPTLVADRTLSVPLPTGADPLHAPHRSPFDLERFERKVHSQGGEDGVLAALFNRVGTTDRFYVEFGCGDGLQCNTAHLRRQGWRGVLMDGACEPAAPDARIHAEWIRPDNIAALFDKYGVPEEFDLLSIDLDGNDWYVWQALDHRPRVVVCEYNANLGPTARLSIPANPKHTWDGTDFYGASLPALVELGRRKGYTLVYCNEAGVNAFFLRDDLVPPGPGRSPAAIYRPPNYWYRGGRQLTDLSRRLVDPVTGTPEGG